MVRISVLADRKLHAVTAHKLLGIELSAFPAAKCAIRPGHGLCMDYRGGARGVSDALRKVGPHFLDELLGNLPDGRLGRLG